jgi:hypothetical protein
VLGAYEDKIISVVDRSVDRLGPFGARMYVEVFALEGFAKDSHPRRVNLGKRQENSRS